MYQFELGTAVVDAYTEAISQVLGHNNTKIKSFHEEDAAQCLHTTCNAHEILGMNRIVRVDSDLIQGHLQWAVRQTWHEQERAVQYQTFTLVTPQVIDPVKYKEDQSIIDPYNLQPAVKKRAGTSETKKG